MNDDVIEGDLRAWLDQHAEPRVPDSLRQFLLDLPTSQANLQRVQRRSPLLAGARGRDLALVLAAAVAVALGASLIAGFGRQPSPPATAFQSAQATQRSPVPAPAETTSPVVPSPSTSPETIQNGGFANGSVGWAITNRRLLLTDDGGATWRTAGPLVDYASFAPKGASFFDAHRGWVISEDTHTSSLNLWRTGDGGASWTRTTLPAVPNGPDLIGFTRTFWIDANHAVIDVAGGMGEGYLDGVLMTADGGLTWTEPAMQSATAGADGIMGDPGFIDPKIGWLAGGAPGTRLWATRDGGETWRLQHLAVPAGYLDDEGVFVGAPTFFNRTDGVVARSFDNNLSAVVRIYRTSDGGKTWQPARQAAPKAASWSFPSAGDWILWEPSHTMAFRSTNQGLLWIEGRITGLPSYADPVMTDDLHGWALSTNPPDSNFYLTRDGGRSWTAVDPLAAPAP